MNFRTDVSRESVRMTCGRSPRPGPILPRRLLAVNPLTPAPPLDILPPAPTGRRVVVNETMSLRWLFATGLVIVLCGCATSNKLAVSADDPTANPPMADVDVFVEELPGLFEIVD